MSKNKYKVEGATAVGVNGERKQRDHTKKGILNARRERRRLEAFGRQVQRVMVVEAAVKGDKVPKDITDYISTFNTPAEALQHARNSLQKIRGGTPHNQLTMKVAPVVAAPAVVTDAKVKSKYKNKKAAAAKKLVEGGTAPVVE